MVNLPRDEPGPPLPTSPHLDPHPPYPDRVPQLPGADLAPGARLHVITGPNGTGKTNLLEAISLLVPGRGLRNARLADLPRQVGRRAASRLGRGGAVRRRAGASAPGPPPDGPPDRRVFRLDGEAPRSQAAIAARLAAVWLTPQMDRLFGEGASGRRRFLDRLVWALEPGHAREVAAHDTAMSSRNRLLAQGGADPAWLAGLEDSMARHAVAAAAARRALVAQLNAALARERPGASRPPASALVDPVADRLDAVPALAAEDWLRAALQDARAGDAAAGSAALGAHRADMALADAATGLPAGLASTGQQKALLLGVILGHAALITAARGHPPCCCWTNRPSTWTPTAARTCWTRSPRPAQRAADRHRPRHLRPLQGLAEGWRTGGDALRRTPAFHPPGVAKWPASAYIPEPTKHLPESPDGMSDPAAPNPESTPSNGAYDADSISVLRGWTRCANGPACISATPMTAPACTTWRSRSSTTRWTRRRPASPRVLADAERATAR